MVWEQHGQEIKKKYNKNAIQIINFVGDVINVGSFIKRHNRRSIKPLIPRMDVDHCFLVDEFNTTNLCSSCYCYQAFQKRTRDVKSTIINGAVTCVNLLCPARLFNKATTKSGDGNASRCIATLVSQIWRWMIMNLYSHSVEDLQLIPISMYLAFLIIKDENINASIETIGYTYLKNT